MPTTTNLPVDPQYPYRINQITRDETSCSYSVHMPVYPIHMQRLLIRKITEHFLRVFGPYFLSDSLEITYTTTGFHCSFTVKDPKQIEITMQKLHHYPSYKSYFGNPSEPNPPGNPQAQEQEADFNVGARTNHHIKHNQVTSEWIEYKGKKYKICTGSDNFASQEGTALASIGHSREVILLDNKSPVMQELYQEFAKTLTSLKQPVAIKDVFEKARQFSRSKINDTDFVIHSAENVRVGANQRPVYPLEKIIEEKKGICRHHAFFTGFLLGQYVKQNKIENTTIHHCRDDLILRNPRTGKQESEAHTWIVCKQNNSFYIVDSMWNLQVNLLNYDEYQKACKLYTQTVIDKTLNRAGLKPPVLTTNLRAELKKPPLREELKKPPLREELKKPPVLPTNLNTELANEIDKIEGANPERIMKLIEEGADVNTQGKESGWTAAHIAAKKNHSVLFERLAAKNANFNLPSKANCTPLFYAQDANMVSNLTYDADFLYKNQHGQSALDHLLARDIINVNNQLQEELDKLDDANAQLIQELVHRGADVNLQGKYSGWTAAHVATATDSLDLMQFLVNKKADLNIKSKRSERTPLFRAASNDMIGLLVKNGADTSLKDAKGISVSEAIKNNGTKEDLQRLPKGSAVGQFFKPNLNGKDRTTEEMLKESDLKQAGPN